MQRESASSVIIAGAAGLRLRGVLAPVCNLLEKDAALFRISAVIERETCFWASSAPWPLVFCGEAFGVILSRIARQKTDYLSFMAGSSILLALASWTIIPRYHLIASEWSVLPVLSGILIAAGLSSAAGMISMYHAMRMGRHGLTWTIGQSALVVPFIMGITLWHDKKDTNHLIGVVMALAGITAMGKAQKDDGPAEGVHSVHGYRSRCWPFSCLVLSRRLPPFFALAPWQDAARLRVPCF
jgi:uncharacterized membrane protein